MADHNTQQAQAKLQAEKIKAKATELEVSKAASQKFYAALQLPAEVLTKEVLPQIPIKPIH